MFFATKNFLALDPELLDRHLESEHASERVTKFRGDRPTDLKDIALKKTAAKHNQH